VRWRSFADARYLEGVCFGLALFSVSLSIFILVEVGWGDTFGRLENYFFGVIAILSAYFSVRALNKQMLQQIELADDERSRRFLRTRATALLELSSIFEEINSVLRWYENPMKPLECNIDTLEGRFRALSEGIEHAPDDVARNLAIFISAFQILKTRLVQHLELYAGRTDVRSVVEWNMDPSMMMGYIDWAAYRTLAEPLLKFARGDTDALRPPHINRHDVELVLDTYYVVPGTVGEAPSRVSAAKREIERRATSGAYLSNFWPKIGVRVT
jgi:hypothetical protein